MIKPKKHLGQHFLTDRSVAKRIVDALDIPLDAQVLEIGPGTGILTGFLGGKQIRFKMVEVDPEAIDLLNHQWPELETAIVRGDVLRLDLHALFQGPFHVIGNFPYNISSQIFFRILEYRDQVRSVVCMIQKEVAKRITAPPGSKDYGILSVLLQAYYHTESLFSVKPGSFFPPPKVTSAVIRLTRNRTRQLTCNEQLFSRVVKATFNQRRKMIRNSLRSILLHLDSDFALLGKRPEQLGVSEFVELTHWVESQQ